MRTKLRFSYRYADLLPGEKFYLPNDNTVYTCGTDGAWYSAHHKKQLSENTRVLPVDPRPVAARRSAAIRAVCKRFDVTRPELTGYYRGLLAATLRRFQGRLSIPSPSSPSEARALEALRFMCLVHWVTVYNPDTMRSESIEIVSGDIDRLYL